MNLVVVPADAGALDVLALRYRTAYEKTQAGREQWIEGTLEFAAVMVDAKKQPELASNVEFSRWLSRHQLEHLHPNDRLALIGLGKLEPAAARKLLEDNLGLAWRTIWEKKASRPQRAVTETGKSTLRDKRKHISGHAARTRIPDVMRDDPPEPKRPPPPTHSFRIKGLTPEQVDPDFKGTPLEFTTKYGHVNLHTKQQIEHNKQQDALMAWAGTVSDLDRMAKAMLTAFAAVDQATLSGWLSKPAKAEKFKAWCKSIELACESLQTIANRT